MSAVSLTLLGGFELTLPPAVHVHLPTRKAQALLAYLALQPEQAQPRDKLASLLWGDVADAQARASLRQTLSLLGKALEHAPVPCLVTEARTVGVVAGAIDVDVSRFEAAIAEGTPGGLEHAAHLYRGELLEGLVLDEAPFESWLLSERERLRELAIEGLAKLLAHHQGAQGSAERAIQTAAGCSRSTPARKSFTAR
jgi:DNA-binding SARP family transcriptional activator